MNIAGHVTALLTSLTPDQLRALSRAERQRLSDQLERVNLMIGDAERAAAGKPESKAGVLCELRGGRQS